MADQEAKIIIRGEDEATKVIEGVDKSINKLNDTTISSTKNLSDWAKSNKQTFSDMAKYGAIAFTGLSIAIGLSINKFALFEKQMSEAKAVLGLFGQDDKTKKQFKELTELAVELGAKTKFTAEQSAEGITILGQAGFTTTEIMKSMSGVLNLAAATNISIADSADIASSILRQFGFDVGETNRVMDVLTATSIKSNASILDLRESFSYFGPTARVLGISIEESSAAIGILADSGIKGSLATRALGTAITKLANPTNKMSDAMQKIGFSAFDNQGKFKGLANIIEELNKGMKNYTQEQKAATVSAIFGSDAYSEMSILLANGSDKLREFTKELQNAKGTTDEMARVQLDNLKGSMELLSGAFDSLAIRLGGVLAPVLRSVVDWIRPIVEKIGEFVNENPRLSATIVVVVTALTGLVAVAGLIGLALPSIIAGFTALGTVLTVLTGPIGIIIALVGLLATARATNFMGIRDTTIPILQEIWSVIQTTFQTIYTYFQEIWAQISLAWTDFLAIFGLTNDQFWTGFFEGLKILWEGVKIYLGVTFEIIKGLFMTAFNFIKTFVGGIFGGLKDLITGFFQIFRGVITGNTQLIWDGFKNMFGGIIKVVLAPVNGVIAIIEGLINSAIGGINKLIQYGNNAIPGMNIPTIGTVSIPRVPAPNFAFGGIVPQNGMIQGPGGLDKTPIMATPGELILNKAQQMNLASHLGSKDSGSPIEIVISGNNFYGDDDSFAEKIGDKIMRMFDKHTAYNSF